MLKKQMTNILVVDDTPENIDIINNILNDEYHIKIALNGLEAIELCCKNEKPDLILLDILMPEMDGYETIKVLKSNPDTANIPVVFITSRDSVEDEYYGLELGAIDYIVRPFQPYIVKMRIKNVIRSIEAEKFKEEVSQIIQHNIKTPLSVIKCESEEFLMMNSDIPPYLKNKFENIISGVEDITSLLSMWSLLFNIESGTYNLIEQPVDIVELLQNIIDSFKCRLTLNRIKVIFDKTRYSAIILSDKTLLTSIFSNLIINAIEADESDSVITITLTIKENSDNFILTINNKKPVPIEIRNKFFHKYVTLGKQNGTGLGTYCAKLFSELLNANLVMQTSENGTTITFER